MNIDLYNFVFDGGLMEVSFKIALILIFLNSVWTELNLQMLNHLSTETNLLEKTIPHFQYPDIEFFDEGGGI